LDEGHCITCSDEGVAMRVLEVTGADLALCSLCSEFGSEPNEVQTDLVGPVEPGDELLVHAGVALLRLSPQSLLEVSAEVAG
jgi:hydrogenase maturation factor